MKTITLTDDEYYFLKAIMERIAKQQERKPRKKKWVKHDGLMINIQTGEAIDVRTNKFVIDVDPELLAHLIEVDDNDTNLRALSGSDVNKIDPKGQRTISTMCAQLESVHQECPTKGGS